MRKSFAFLWIARMKLVQLLMILRCAVKVERRILRNLVYKNMIVSQIEEKNTNFLTLYCIIDEVMRWKIIRFRFLFIHVCYQMFVVVDIKLSNQMFTNERLVLIMNVLEFPLNASGWRRISLYVAMKCWKYQKAFVSLWHSQVNLFIFFVGSSPFIFINIATPKSHKISGTIYSP